MWYIVKDDELYHHGIKGQKWGVRRFQNSDGTLTAAGRKRYETEETRRVPKKNRAKKVISTAIRARINAVIFPFVYGARGIKILVGKGTVQEKLRAAGKNFADFLGTATLGELRYYKHQLNNIVGTDHSNVALMLDGQRFMRQMQMQQSMNSLQTMQNQMIGF